MPNKKSDLIYVQMPHENWHFNAIDAIQDAAAMKSATFVITVNKRKVWRFRNGCIQSNGADFIKAVADFLCQLYPEYKPDESE